MENTNDDNEEDDSGGSDDDRPTLQVCCWVHETIQMKIISTTSVDSECFFPIFWHLVPSNNYIHLKLCHTSAHKPLALGEWGLISSQCLAQG